MAIASKVFSKKMVNDKCGDDVFVWQNGDSFTGFFYENGYLKEGARVYNSGLFFEGIFTTSGNYESGLLKYPDKSIYDG